MVFSATFNNISVISWRLVLLEETGENHLLTQKRHDFGNSVPGSGRAQTLLNYHQYMIFIQFLPRDGHKHCSITTSIWYLFSSWLGTGTNIAQLPPVYNIYSVPGSGRAQTLLNYHQYMIFIHFKSFFVGKSFFFSFNV